MRRPLHSRSPLPQLLHVLLLLHAARSASTAYIDETFVEVPRSRQVNAGTRVLLECGAPAGSPPPLVSWEKNGLRLDLVSDESSHINNNHLESHVAFRLLANATLLIANATINHNGDYVCVATSSAGVRRSPAAHLTVFGRFFLFLF